MARMPARLLVGFGVAVGSPGAAGGRRVGLSLGTPVAGSSLFADAPTDAGRVNYECRFGVGTSMADVPPEFGLYGTHWVATGRAGMRW